MNNNDLDITELTQEIFYIFAAWKINANQQQNLLGISNLRETLPINEDVIARAQMLVAIDQSVCLTFPHAPQLARLWITTPSHLLADRTPLEVMLVEGLPGIKYIQALLEGVNF